MSKRLITVLVTVFTVMLLTGCNSDKKAVTETVDGFLNAMVANDMEKASQYATEEFMKSDTMKMMDPEYLADTFYAAMGIGKDDLDVEAQNAVNEYVKKVVDKAYKSFEVQDIKVQEETAAVTARITLGYNPPGSLSDIIPRLLRTYPMIRATWSTSIRQSTMTSWSPSILKRARRQCIRRSITI